LVVQLPAAQVETVEAPPRATSWLAHGRIEGHLALRYSPASAFSPDSRLLAVAAQDQIVLYDLAEGGARKILRPQVEGIRDLNYQSANFLDPDRLLLLGAGMFRAQAGAMTPLLAIQWDAERDTLVGKVNSVGAGPGYGQPRWLPAVQYVVIYKEANIDLWKPATGWGGRLSLPFLTHRPDLIEFSPDGRWLIFARVDQSSVRDPSVVLLQEQRPVDLLAGHPATVQSVSFSRDASRVVTSCEDGRVRLFSVPDWRPVFALVGHNGPAHWAEFSPDGRLIASAGEDSTVRVWSVEEGRLVQTLTDSKVPLRTVAFSPDGNFIAASGDDVVHVWRRQ
jgi:WD40 repeat protein